MFDYAAEHLKNPKISFTNFKLYRTNKGKFPGAVYVSSISGEGWLARIERDGKLTLNPKPLVKIEGLEAELSLLAEDPVTYTASYGQRTGNCCFCHLTLTDERSLAVGYGPVCAKHYGLPWGEKLEDAIKPKETKAEKIERYLAHCNGFGDMYEHNFFGYKFLYSEGVHYIAEEAGCYWLIDLIISYQGQPKCKRPPMSEFQIWELFKNDDNSCLVVGSADTDVPVFRQRIEYTDFPLNYIRFYYENKVLHLPQER